MEYNSVRATGRSPLRFNGIAFFLFVIFFPVACFASTGNLFQDLSLPWLVAYALAKIMGWLSEKIGMPDLIGEIGAGIILGNLFLFGIHWEGVKILSENVFFQYAQELGVIFLLFLVGLESNLSDLLKAGPNAFMTAVIGVILPTFSGVFFAKLTYPESSLVVALLYGATFAATSVGITAKILKDFGKLKTSSAQIILGAAVIDDVLGLMLLAAISGIVMTGSLSVVSLGMIVFKVILFFVLAILFGHFVMPQLFRAHRHFDKPGNFTALAVMLALLFAVVSAKIELAPIVGAFVAGLLLDEVKFRHAPGLTVHRFEDVIQPIANLFLPIFFIVIGLKVDLRVFADRQQVLVIFVLLVLAILGKMLAGIFCRGKNLDRLGIGFGMIPRGEVGLIFASFGISHQLIDTQAYSILVIGVLLTTIVGPLLLKQRLKKF